MDNTNCPVSRFIEATRHYGLLELLQQCNVHYDREQEHLRIQGSPGIVETLWTQHLLLGHCAREFHEFNAVEIASDHSELLYRFPANLLDQVCDRDRAVLDEAIVSGKPFSVVSIQDERVIYANPLLSEWTGISSKHWLHCDVKPFWKLPRESSDGVPRQLAQLYRDLARSSQVRGFEGTIWKAQYIPQLGCVPCDSAFRIVADVFLLNYFDFPCRLTIVQDYVEL